MDLNKATLIQKKNLTYDVIELKFKPQNSGMFFQNFKAGKFISIKVPGEKITFRSYSISGITETGEFELCVKIVEGGSGSNFLNSLNEETEIEYLGPNGHFIFNTQQNKKVFMVATGTGLAPIKAMLEEQLTSGNAQKFELVFGIRFVKDIFYKNLFDSIATKYSNFKYSIAVSRPEDESFTGFVGRVTDYLRAQNLDANSTEVYICGLKEMVDEVNNIMIEKGLSKESIHFERFN